MCRCRACDGYKSVECCTSEEMCREGIYKGSKEEKSAMSKKDTCVKKCTKNQDCITSSNHDGVCLADGGCFTEQWKDEKDEKNGGKGGTRHVRRTQRRRIRG